MLKQAAVLLLLLTVLLSFQCRKHKHHNEDEVDKLPPITQSGENTFGCLVNGKAWTPKGWTGNQPNFLVIADPTFKRETSACVLTDRVEVSMRDM